jgi:hypothetical protein
VVCYYDLHTLHYACSPFYCTVRIGSQTVESARVSLLTECGPCSPARSQGTGVAILHCSGVGPFQCRLGSLQCRLGSHMHRHPRGNSTLGLRARIAVPLVPRVPYPVLPRAPQNPQSGFALSP